MEKRWTLSDQIRTNIVVAQNTGGLINANDVKEFIQKFKARVKPQHTLLLNYIDELAGDKLI